MRALDLMLGERSPTYVNSDNITDDDFFTYQGKSADEIFIWLELCQATLLANTILGNFRGLRRLLA